jgi:hypothetical protein
VSATEIINELPKLTQAERQAVLDKLHDLAKQEGEQATGLNDMKEEPAAYHVDLRPRGISETQAADLRTRLKTFSEDWDRPEAAIYDEDPPR